MTALLHFLAALLGGWLLLSTHPPVVAIVAMFTVGLAFDVALWARRRA